MHTDSYRVIQIGSGPYFRSAVNLPSFRQQVLIYISPYRECSGFVCIVTDDI